MSAERTWDQRILEVIPSGVDETLLAENLRLSPTERLEKLQRFLEQLEALRRVIDFRRALSGFVDARADVVVIGGVALTLRGGARATYDLDLCYDRDPANLPRVVAALAALRPRLRGADPSLPFFWDVATVRSGCNFTLSCDAGDIDLLGEVTGLGGFRDVAQLATPLSLFGLEMLVLDLDGLERAKRAVGRAKDLLDLAEIAALRNRRP